MDCVVLDFGNVLLRFQPRDYLASLGYAHAQVDFYYDIVFASQHWLDLDRGVVDQQSVMERLCWQYPDHQSDIAHIFADWFDMLTPMDQSVALLRDLKRAGHRCFGLSNFHQAAYEHVSKAYPWFAEFDGILVSSEVQYLKPEISIYRALCDRYDLNPPHCVFVDDMQVNVDGAVQYGFHGIVFEHAHQVRQELVRLGFLGGENDESH